MAVRKREGWRKEIGVAIASKRGRNAIEEEEKIRLSAEYQIYRSTAVPKAHIRPSSHSVLSTVNFHS
jgi:hypothetical protein